MDERLTDVYDLLYRLGVTANYTGFFHTSYAVLLCLEQPDRLQLVTKWLYPEVAKHYQAKWTAVERNIRTVGGIIWRENRPLLELLGQKPLHEKPRNAQLLAILAASLDDPLRSHPCCAPLPLDLSDDSFSSGPAAPFAADMSAL